jgi:hypothetical protein
VIALNYLDPICVDGDGCLGLTTYPIDDTHARITLADDPDPAELGRLAHGRARSGERSVVSPSGWAVPTTARSVVASSAASRT